MTGGLRSATPAEGVFLRERLPVFLLFLLTVALFLPSCGNGFIAAYDDEIYLTLNQTVRQGLTLGGVRWAFITLQGGNWHPVTWLSHMLDVTLFGLAPAGHHLVSLLVHGGSTLLLYRLLIQLGLGPKSAWLTALLFAIHPQRVESVAWAAERKDVLSVFFGLAALTFYLDYLRRPGRGRYLAVTLVYLLSLLSKATLVTLPLLMLALDHFLHGRLRGAMRRQALLEKLPLLMLAGGIAVVTWHAQQGSNALVAAPPGDRLFVALAAYGEYLRLFVAPFGLSFHYPLDTMAIGFLRPLAGFLFLAAGVPLLRRQASPLPALGWCWFALTLLPVSGVIRYGGQFVADRYTYFPHIGLLLMLAWGGERLLASRPGLKRVAGVVLPLLLAGMVFLTVRQIGYWRDGERLYRRAIELNPANWLAHSNLGAALVQQERYGEGFVQLARGQLLRGRPVEALATLQSARRAGGVPEAELTTLQREIMARLP